MDFKDMAITVICFISVFMAGIFYEKECPSASLSDSPSAGQNVSGAVEISLQEADRAYIEVIMNVSAYCLCEKCCGRWFKDGFNAEGVRITASGVPAKGKLIAAPRIYPFGTIMDVPGYGDGVEVQDRGGVITGNKIDLLFPSHKEALNWGRRILKVKVYQNN